MEEPLLRAAAEANVGQPRQLLRRAISASGEPAHKGTRVPGSLSPRGRLRGACPEAVIRAGASRFRAATPVHWSEADRDGCRGPALGVGGAPPERPAHRRVEPV